MTTYMFLFGSDTKSVYSFMCVMVIIPFFVVTCHFAYYHPSDHNAYTLYNAYSSGIVGTLLYFLIVP